MFRALFQLEMLKAFSRLSVLPPSLRRLHFRQTGRDKTNKRSSQNRNSIYAAGAIINKAPTLYSLEQRKFFFSHHCQRKIYPLQQPQTATLSIPTTVQLPISVFVSFPISSIDHCPLLLQFKFFQVSP